MILGTSGVLNDKLRRNVVFQYSQREIKFGIRFLIHLIKALKRSWNWFWILKWIGLQPNRGSLAQWTRIYSHCSWEQARSTPTTALFAYKLQLTSWCFSSIGLAPERKFKRQSQLRVRVQYLLKSILNYEVRSTNSHDCC